MTTVMTATRTILTSEMTECKPMKFLKGLNKNQKGLTLIELLAVIVIMAIIAAIAIPSISGIITKTKFNTQKANAQVLIDSARIKIAAEDFTADGGTGNTQTITLNTLHTNGYLDKIPTDPVKNTNYSDTNSRVVVTRDAVTGTLSYSVTLAPTTGTAYIDNKQESELKSLTPAANSSSPSPS